MTVKMVLYEDFVNYKKPSMFVITPHCSFKCEKECGVRCCQNSDLAKLEDMDIDDNEIIKKYLSNDITKAIIFGGLEPFDSFDELYVFIVKFRNDYGIKDDIVIYSGYNEDEIKAQTDAIKGFGNIIVKYGRFIPNSDIVFDKTLGVELASSNQYAVRI